MDFEAMMRDAAVGYSRVPTTDHDRTEARMSASTGKAIWRGMALERRFWPDGSLVWDESKLNDARLFGLRIRRDDSVSDGEVQYWTQR